jgi:hypothetical protein
MDGRATPSDRPLGDGACLLCGQPIEKGITVCASCAARSGPPHTTPPTPVIAVAAPVHTATPTPSADSPPAIALGVVHIWREDTNALSKTIHIIVWLFALLATVYTAFDYSISKPESAPQQAALGAMSAAQVVMAYVFARAVDEILWHTARRWKAGESK